MITEETIGQTRFFKHIDGGFFLVKEIKEVTQIVIVNCQDGGEFRTILGGEDCKKFAPVDVSFKAFVQNQVTAQLPPTAHNPIQSKPNRTVRDKARTARKPAVAKTRKNHSTGHKGVKLDGTFRDGRTRYAVNFYDKDTKRVRYLGIFDNVFLAAARYQDEAGDKAEAARLRAQAKQQQADIVEQAQNNPDRPTAAGRKKKTRMIYVCKRCGIEWKTKPKYCPHCDNDDFREVPEE